MRDKDSVFEKTYRDYLSRIAGMDVRSVAEPLGGRVEGAGIRIPLFGEFYTISKNGIADVNGKQPPLDVCVILSKYLLLCPSAEPRGSDWASYRDLKDSGPLTVFFSHDVEQAIAEHFRGKLAALKEACENIGGCRPDMDVSHDLSMQFDALPRVPLLLIFNDADDEFPARASVLFERRSESYLDPESLAMAGRLLFTYLKRAAKFEILTVS